MITNKGELFAALTRYLKRPDLVDLYDNWLDFASTRIDTECRLSQQEYRSTAVANSQFLPLPIDYLEMRNIQINSYPLEYQTPAQLDCLRLRNLTGKTRYYTVMNGQVELLTTPADDSTAEIEIFYYAKQPVLVSDTDTNAILVSFPNLYLYACMLEAMPFIEHEKGQQTWGSMFQQTVKTLNDAAERGRFSGAPLKLRAL